VDLRIKYKEISIELFRQKHEPKYGAILLIKFTTAFTFSTLSTLVLLFVFFSELIDNMYNICGTVLDVHCSNIKMLFHLSFLHRRL
jgi:hypothetical protein